VEGSQPQESPGHVSCDGTLDMVVGLASSGLRLFLNPGKGGLTDQTRASGPGGFGWTRDARDPAFAGFDKDGDLDLLAMSGSAYGSSRRTVQPRKQRPSLGTRNAHSGREHGLLAGMRWNWRERGR